MGDVNEKGPYLDLARYKFVHENKEVKIVPEWHERDAEVESEGASKLRHQVAHWVDQLLGQDLGYCLLLREIVNLCDALLSCPDGSLTAQ